MDRQSIVAGQFYPKNRTELESEVKKYLDAGVKARPALAAIAPHAGYIYSGGVAGTVFASVEVPKRCIIISPNHTGMGTRSSVWPSGNWLLPTGKIPVDEKLAEKLLSLSPEFKSDTNAHLAEHSIEVELPFLLARQKDISIVPITVSHMHIGVCEKLGEAIAAAIISEDGKVLIVASTDMNHYEDQKRTLEKDKLAIEKVLALDAEGLLEICGEHHISMCGVIPTAITIFACKKLGAKKATLIKHETSGNVSGDYSAVVGYAGFVIE